MFRVGRETGNIGIFFFWPYLPFSVLMLAPIDLQWGKCCPEDSNFILGWIFIKLAANINSHKISGEFDYYSLRSFLPLSDESFSHRHIMEKMLSGG